jgi:hypothetical protein
MVQWRVSAGKGKTHSPQVEKSAEILAGKIDCRVVRCNPAEVAVWRVERKTDACAVVFGNARSAEALSPSREEKDACVCRVVY